MLERPVLSALRLNTGRLLSAAGNKFAGIVDLSQIPANLSSSKNPISATLERDAMFHANPQGEEAEEDSPELEVGIDRPHEVTDAIKSRVHEAKANGLSQKCASDLRSTQLSRKKALRIRLGNEGPALVEPIHVEPKPNFKPVIAKTRRYSPEPRKNISLMVDKLVKYGYVKKNC